MRIVVDENIPLGKEAFSSLGEVVMLPGRTIAKCDLEGVEGLAVRSITKVNAELIEGTPVRFVATATIGTDHLDMEWMDAQGIRHGSAPGCNANSVGDYFAATLLHIAQKRGETLEGKTLGVVGCGNVGSRVARRARAMGMNTIENDPPLRRQTGDERYRPLEELFGADFITVHTPLNREGRDATLHLVDAAFLGKMGEKGFFMNSSRGAVVDCAALKAALETRQIGGAALDVWEGEPSIDPRLVERIELATPHIAGYSFDGKIGGTTQIYHHFCRWLEVEPTWSAAPLLPEPDVRRIEIDATNKSDEDALREAVFAVYPIDGDDAALRETMALDEAERGEAFDTLRKNYPRRREFSLTEVVLRNGSEKLARKFQDLTFQIATPDGAIQ